MNRLLLFLFLFSSVGAYSTCENLSQLVKKNGLGSIIADYARLKDKIKTETDLAAHAMLEEGLETSLARIRNAIGQPNLTETEILELAAQLPTTAVLLKPEPEETGLEIKKGFSRQLLEWAEDKFTNPTSEKMAGKILEATEQVSDDAEIEGLSAVGRAYAREIGLSEDEFIEQMTNARSIYENEASRNRAHELINPIASKRGPYKPAMRLYESQLQKYKGEISRSLSAAAVFSTGALISSGLYFLGLGSNVTVFGMLLLPLPAAISTLCASYSSLALLKTILTKPAILKSPIPEYPSLLKIDEPQDSVGVNP